MGNCFSCCDKEESEVPSTDIISSDVEGTFNGAENTNPVLDQIGDGHYDDEIPLSGALSPNRSSTSSIPLVNRTSLSSVASSVSRMASDDGHEHEVHNPIVNYHTDQKDIGVETKDAAFAGFDLFALENMYLERIDEFGSLYSRRARAKLLAEEKKGNEYLNGSQDYNSPYSTPMKSRSNSMSSSATPASRRSSRGLSSILTLHDAKESIIAYIFEFLSIEELIHFDNQVCSNEQRPLYLDALTGMESYMGFKGKVTLGSSQNKGYQVKSFGAVQWIRKRAIQLGYLRLPDIFLHTTAYSKYGTNSPSNASFDVTLGPDISNTLNKKYVQIFDGMKDDIPWLSGFMTFMQGQAGTSSSSDGSPRKGSTTPYPLPPVFYFALKGDNELVKVLLKSMTASERFDAMTFCYFSIIKSNDEGKPLWHRQGLLHIAAKRNDNQLLKIIMNTAHELNIESINTSGKLIDGKSNDMSSGRGFFVDVDLQDSDGLTSLHIAARDGNRRMVENLVKLYGSNPNTPCKYVSWTPYHIAIKEGYFDILKVLLQYKVSSNGNASSAKSTPNKKKQNQQDIYRLNQSLANVTSSGNTCIHFLFNTTLEMERHAFIELHHTDIIHALRMTLDHTTSNEDNSSNSSNKYKKRRSSNGLRTTFNNNESSALDEEHEVLNMTSPDDQFKMLELLMKLNHNEVTKCLNIGNKVGDFPLHLACESQWKAHRLHYVVQNTAPRYFMALNSKHLTPYLLILLNYRGNLKKHVEMLPEPDREMLSQCNWNIDDDHCKVPFIIYALMHERADVVLTLLKKKFSILNTTLIDDDKNTVFHYLVMRADFLSVFDSLLVTDENTLALVSDENMQNLFSATNVDNETPLHIAAACCVQSFQEDEERIEYVSTLHYLLMQKDRLAARGVTLNLNAADRHGNTPLHIMASMGEVFTHEKYKQLLVAGVKQHNGDVNVKNQAGQTVIDVAKEASSELKEALQAIVE
jgi:ankyrin repeat protein